MVSDSDPSRRPSSREQSLDQFINQFEAIKEIDPFAYDAGKRAASTIIFNPVEDMVSSVLDDLGHRPCNIQRGEVSMGESNEGDIEYRAYSGKMTDGSSVETVPTSSLRFSARSLTCKFLGTGEDGGNREVTGMAVYEVATDGRKAVAMVHPTGGEIELSEHERNIVIRDLLGRINAAVAAHEQQS